MLAVLMSTLWVATVWFTNPATGNFEFSRIIPQNQYQNDSETCGNNLKILMSGAEKLGMKLDSGYCVQMPADSKFELHGFAGMPNGYDKNNN